MPVTFAQTWAQQRKIHTSTEHLSLPSHTKDVRCKTKDIALYHLHTMVAGVDSVFSSFLLSFLLLNLSTNYFHGFSVKQQWWNPWGNNEGKAGRCHHPHLSAKAGMMIADWTLVELQTHSVLVSHCSTVFVTLALPSAPLLLLFAQNLVCH